MIRLVLLFFFFYCSLVFFRNISVYMNLKLLFFICFLYCCLLYFYFLFQLSLTPLSDLFFCFLLFIYLLIFYFHSSILRHLWVGHQCWGPGRPGLRGAAGRDRRVPGHVAVPAGEAGQPTHHAGLTQLTPRQVFSAGLPTIQSTEVPYPHPEGEGRKCHDECC